MGDMLHDMCYHGISTGACDYCRPQSNVDEVGRLRDEVAELRRENTLLIEAGRRWLACVWSLPGGRYPTSAEVRREAGLPIN